MRKRNKHARLNHGSALNVLVLVKLHVFCVVVQQRVRSVLSHDADEYVCDTLVHQGLDISRCVAQWLERRTRIPVVSVQFQSGGVVLK